MAQDRYVFKGKTALTGVTSEGVILSLNVENLTIVADDQMDDLGYWNFDSLLSLPPETVYYLEGDLATIADNGSVFEVRSSE